mmetsp:Transcript_9952/g.16384  ORF Transcript_9952/g.16384 Transcript_9952/m.16384 type:complete len:342 (+) Transcript_9952:173-1198(+)
MPALAPTTFVNAIGEKGANLCEMLRIGLPIPPAFNIVDKMSTKFFHENELSADFLAELRESVHTLEGHTGKKFGGVKGIQRPLLLSVRSSPAVPMPGMKETILNLGMNDAIMESMIRLTENKRWAQATYIKFLRMFGTVVRGVDSAKYQTVFDMACKKYNMPHESLLTSTQLVDVIAEFKKLADVPEDPWEQLKLSIEAVYRSWYSPRVVQFRETNGIPADLGTGVTVQSMVYGNMNMLSGTGVMLTKNPTTGIRDNDLYGVYLANAEGDEILAKKRQPMTLYDVRVEQPEIYNTLLLVVECIENDFDTTQEVEFTVENMHLAVLETRPAKSSLLLPPEHK